jgi:hypothetical protein
LDFSLFQTQTSWKYLHSPLDGFGLIVLLRENGISFLVEKLALHSVKDAAESDSAVSETTLHFDLAVSAAWLYFISDSLTLP